jgi:hypothetical protein
MIIGNELKLEYRIFGNICYDETRQKIVVSMREIDLIYFSHGDNIAHFCTDNYRFIFVVTHDNR